MLMNGIEAWTVRKRDKSRIRTGEVKFMSRTAGYTGLDYTKTLDVKKVLHTQRVMEFIDNYRCNWKNHVLEMAAQESRSEFFVTNQEDDDLWQDPSYTVTKNRNRPLVLRH
jgi:hypothetical protein